MTDLEARLRAAGGSLPEAPEVPCAARRAVAEAVAGASRQPGLLDRARRRRRRIGGVLALAPDLSGTGLALGCSLPYGDVPEAGNSYVRLVTLR